MTLDPTRPYGNFDFDDRKYLEEHCSTSAILNTAARDAGVEGRGQGVHVHGEDKTYEELKAEQKGEAVHKPEPYVEMAKTFASQFVEGGHGSELLKQVNDVDGLVAPISLFKTLVTEWHGDWVKGKQLNAALIRDAMHVGLVESMKGMPACYVDRTKEERPHAAGGDHGPHAKIVETLMRADHKDLRALLQIRTDEGMKTAVDYVRGGAKGSPSAFLKSQGLERRYREDAAFHAGFDAMTYAADTSKAQFEQARVELEARDARLNLTQVFKG